MYGNVFYAWSASYIGVDLVMSVACLGGEMSESRRCLHGNGSVKHSVAEVGVTFSKIV